VTDRAPPPPVHPPRKLRRRRWLIVAALVFLVPIALLSTVALVLTQGMGWSPRRQDSGVMRPGLLLNDYFWVAGRAYSDTRRPDYGDVVAIAVPRRMIGFSGPGADVTFMSRIVGLPGDQVAVVNGVVSVNGKPWPQEPLGEPADDRPSRIARKLMRLRERAPNGTSYEILRHPEPGEEGTYSVPPGHYFVLGDSRDDSLDSRFWAKVGNWYLPAGNVKGRATFVYWSGTERLDRIGTALK
jgi:signal peptidase I